MRKKSIIFGIRGMKLTSAEKRLLAVERPWGIILFSRNIKDLFQLKLLIKNIKYITRDKNYPILIDQEGGGVSRLNKIINLNLFSQEYFGKLYKLNRKNFNNYYKSYIEKVCAILKNVGININTTPVLDVRRINTHKILKRRCFSEDPLIVSKIGKLCVEFHKKNKIATVIKHIPGHGLAKFDSHKELPIIKTNKTQLINKDFKTFRDCKSFFAMTAHVVYFKYDPEFAATHSKIIINDIIRHHIGFKGILISDDISMGALKYGLVENAIKALDAGCNLILHCNGNINEMGKLAKVIPKIDNFIEKKTSDFYKFLG